MFYEYTSSAPFTREIKAGVIGCGGIAFGKHLPSLKKLGNVKLTAFCDIVPERAEHAAREYGAPGAAVYADYRELLKHHDDIEVIHVLTPNCSHAEISIAALDAGKHVMCEKPMAMNGREADAMCEAAKRNGRLLTIGYQTRSTNNSQYLRRLVKDGALGEIYYIKCPAVRRRGVPGWGVFIDREQQGGGPLIDIATHSIDNALYITGMYDVESVMGASFQKLAKTNFLSNDMGIYDPDKFTTEDAAFGFVRFKRGAVMLVESSWALNMTDAGPATFCGTKAGATLTGTVNLNGELNGSLYTQSISTNPRMRALFRDENLSAEDYEQKQWYSAILNGTELLTKPEEAAMVTKIIEAIYISSETGKAVYFD